VPACRLIAPPAWLRDTPDADARRASSHTSIIERTHTAGPFPTVSPGVFGIVGGKR